MALHDATKRPGIPAMDAMQEMVGNEGHKGPQHQSERQGWEHAGDIQQKEPREGFNLPLPPSGPRQHSYRVQI